MTWSSKGWKSPATSLLSLLPWSPYTKVMFLNWLSSASGFSMNLSKLSWPQFLQILSILVLCNKTFQTEILWPRWLPPLRSPLNSAKCLATIIEICTHSPNFLFASFDSFLKPSPTTILYKMYLDNFFPVKMDMIFIFISPPFIHCSVPKQSSSLSQILLICCSSTLWNDPSLSVFPSSLSFSSSFVLQSNFALLFHFFRMSHFLPRLPF